MFIAFCLSFLFASFMCLWTLFFKGPSYLALILKLLLLHTCLNTTIAYHVSPIISRLIFCSLTNTCLETFGLYDGVSYLAFMLALCDCTHGSKQQSSVI